jgi:hypothetical protein
MPQGCKQFCRHLVCSRGVLSVRHLPAKTLAIVHAREGTRKAVGG